MADLLGFNHGARVIESDDTIALIRTPQASVVAVVATADTSDGEDTFGMHKAVLIKGETEAAKLKKLSPSSDMRRAIEAIFKQDSTYVYAVRVPKADNLNDQVAAGVGNLADQTGVHALKRIYGLPEFERRHRPRMVIMPGMAGADFLPAHQELATMLPRMRAWALLDGPNTTDEAAVAWRAQYASDRIYPIDPRVVVYGTDTNAYHSEFASPYFAGVRARTDRKKGFWWSISNKAINGISGVSRPVAYGDVANYLNENHVNTIIPSDDGGYITWGNRMATGQAHKLFQPVRVTTDIINEAIEREYRRFNDQPMTPANVKLLLESGNAFMRALAAEGAIYKGEMFWDRTRNLDSELGQGRVTLGVKFLVPPPMEDIRIFQYYELSYFTVLRSTLFDEVDVNFRIAA